MTKRSLLYIFIISLSLATMIIIIGVTMSFSSKKANAHSQVTTASSAIQFVLKEYNGKLGLFRGEAPTPYRTLDFDISYLSEYDRELLRSGIGVDTESELESLIEDYTS